jgi:GntR family transcriptional regulator
MPGKPVDLFVSDTRKPKYGRIQDSILDHIRRGDWSPGDRIPPERELARIFAASVGTVRNALQNLVNQGYLSREQGRGTFVRKSIEHTDVLRYFRFVGSFDDQVPPLTIKCLHLPRAVTLPEVSKILELPPRGKVFQVERCFLMGTRPLVYVTSFLPCGLFDDFSRFQVRDFEDVPIYRLLEREYNIPTLGTRERFCAVAADDVIADILRVTPGAPVLKIMMVALTTRSTVYEYQVSYCNTTDRQIYREFPGQAADNGL